ncbi:MAG: DinB family protein [Candidatus Kapabacteria bacterium]|nr:DinB family protein [Candidatus Kapabacteria bacterium]
MKNDIINSLYSSEREVVSLVTSLLSDDFARSINDGWSVGLNLQHILDIELLVFESAQTVNSEIEFTNKAEQIHHIMLISERKFKAPSMFYPKEPITSANEFISKFKSIRSRIYSYIENNSLDAMSNDGHPLFGSLSQQEWFIFLHTHTLRHLKQIQSILSSSFEINDGTNS